MVGPQLHKEPCCLADGSLAGIRRTTEDQVAVQYEALGRRRFCESGGEENVILLAEGAGSHPLVEAGYPSARTCLWHVGLSPSLKGKDELEKHEVLCCDSKNFQNAIIPLFHSYYPKIILHEKVHNTL